MVCGLRFSKASTLTVQTSAPSLALLLLMQMLLLPPAALTTSMEQWSAVVPLPNATRVRDNPKGARDRGGLRGRT
jgi:hypothetical protein